jgi:hypothetical protein
MYTEFWWDNVSVRGHLEDVGIDGRRLLNVFSKIGMGRYGLYEY